MFESDPVPMDLPKMFVNDLRTMNAWHVIDSAVTQDAPRMLDLKTMSTFENI